ncbi:3',5'-cyclic adenosine monophosphate phosphodiesterase CpdA [Gryllotalpicola daejeonensis]|uniref:3',5'-cyclic adenosine monophosphate phosphodiesterase CpdA n=1 Tax=Gryllotalpicola daejeonensis TaxID=993087 RepID=A0ABP7ZD21_9MICO
MNPLWPSQYPRPEQLIVHLSDTHFTAGRAPMFGIVDSDEILAQALRQLSGAGLSPSAIVITGDIADTGADDAYARVRAAIEPVAAELGAELVWVMGNHDNRAAFRSGLLDVEGSDEPYDRVIDLDGLRLVVLDSTVPGFHYGALADEQLKWLASVLAEPAPRGTLLALHHPPIPSPQIFDELIELRDQAKLEEVVRGTDVRGILAGHLHYSTHSTFAGVPVSVASATCYTNDPLLSQTGLRAQAGGHAFDIVHVYGDRMLHTTIPIGEWPTVYEVTAEQAAQIFALPEEQQQELARRYVTVGELSGPAEL